MTERPSQDGYSNLYNQTLHNPEDIASLISYELRTPLTSIRASLGLLHTGMLGTLPEKGQRMLEIALSNTDRLMRLVEVLDRVPDCGIERDALPWAAPTHAVGEQNDANEVNDAIDPTDPMTQKLLSLNLWRQQSYYDIVTGLPTQAALLHGLELAIAQSQQHPFALLLLDLDRFQIINSSIGQIAGDHLLKLIAQRLTSKLPTAAAIARLRADEFAVLLNNVSALDGAIEVANRIQAALTEPFNVDDQEIFVSASIGVVWGSSRYAHPEMILHDADIAMHRAKALGRARYEIFDPNLQLQASSRLRLETDLRLALERQELQLYFQPIVALANNTITGFEALLRWHHPEQGAISPAKFIPLAEETRLINPIGQWVLRQACQQLCQWQRQFPHYRSLSVSVNLSAQQFAQTDLVEQIRAVLQETEIAPHSLKLEITESSIMESPEAATAMLYQLKALGVQIYIDDFGTGFSSLAYLHRFPADTLKIDRSFVSRIDVDGEQLEIVRAITQLAWNLGMIVVAEGVETKKQLAQLNLLKCDYAQGYFFSKPVDSRAAEVLLSQGRCLPIPLPDQ